MDDQYYGWFDGGIGLILACKQIYEEVTKVIYEQNTFDFDTPLSLSMFAHEIRPAHFNSIKSLKNL